MNCDLSDRGDSKKGTAVLFNTTIPLPFRITLYKDYFFSPSSASSPLRSRQQNKQHSSM